VRAVLRSRWKVLWCTLPTALLMAWSPIWDEEINARGATFLPKAVAVIYYGIFFLFGWMVHRHADLLKEFQHDVAIHLILGFVALLTWGILFRALGAGGLNFPKLAWPVYLLAGSANAWCFCFGLMGLFLGRCNVESRPVRYLADASYWIYLAHLPLVIALQEWIVPMRFGAWMKFFAINVVTFAVLIPSYHWFVRFTLLGTVLNGVRRKLK
jgi:peptidoglycan/LPS O-acetylase OafA/YrhL